MISCQWLIRPCILAAEMEQSAASSTTKEDVGILKYAGGAGYGSAESTKEPASPEHDQFTITHRIYNIGAFLVDLVGRKLLLIVNGTGMLFRTVTLGTSFYVTRPELCATTNLTVNALAQHSDDIEFCNANLASIAIVSLILFNAAFSIGWGPVPWVLLRELIPLRVREVGSGIATFINWGTAAIVTGFYLDFAETVNAWFAWWIFSVLNVMAVLFVAIFVFETKGKNLEDIQHRFDSKH